MLDPPDCEQGDVAGGSIRPAPAQSWNLGDPGLGVGTGAGMSPVFSALRKQGFHSKGSVSNHTCHSNPTQPFWVGCKVQKDQSDTPWGARLLAPSWQTLGHPNPWHRSAPAQLPALTRLSLSLPRNYHGSGRSCTSCFSEKSGC